MNSLLLPVAFVLFLTAQYLLAEKNETETCNECKTIGNIMDRIISREMESFEEEYRAKYFCNKGDKECRIIFHGLLAEYYQMIQENSASNYCLEKKICTENGTDEIDAAIVISSATPSSGNEMVQQQLVDKNETVACKQCKSIGNIVDGMVARDVESFDEEHPSKDFCANDDNKCRVIYHGLLAKYYQFIQENGASKYCLEKKICTENGTNEIAAAVAITGDEMAHPQFFDRLIKTKREEN